MAKDKSKNIENSKSEYFEDKLVAFLKEAELDLEKGQAKITAIRGGWSKNGYYYTENALQDISRLLNNKGKLFVDHVSEKSTKHGRTLFEWAATVDNVLYEGNRVDAVIDFTGNPKTAWLKEEAMKHPEEIQFSINAGGKAVPGKREGKEGYIVESVRLLKSVDLVDYASAGGELQEFRASVIEDLQEAEWSTEYINNLPDGAFAVIEPAYIEGETDDKRARHLPHHTQSENDESSYVEESGRVRDDSDATVDMIHLRNALARVSQIEAVTDSITTQELREIAKEHLQKHKDLLDTDTQNTEAVVSEKEFLKLQSELKEAVSTIDDLKENYKDKEVDNMKLSELKKEYPELLNDFLESEKDEIIDNYKESQKIVEKMEEKDTKISELNSKVEELEESIEEKDNKLGKYEMKEKVNDRKNEVSKILENSKLNSDVDELPDSVKNNLLDLDKDVKEVKEAVADLEKFATSDDFVSGAGDSKPVDEKKKKEDDTIDITENDKEAAKMLK